MSERECRCELKRGELLRHPFDDWQHALIASNVAGDLTLWVDAHRLGEVVLGVGFQVERAPATVRAIDIAFLSRERLAALGRAEGYPLGGPHLAVEIVSGFDLAQALQLKIRGLLAGGTRLLWLVYPSTETVMVYRANGSVEERTLSQSLDGEDVVPGFSLPLADVFSTAI